MKLVAFAAIIAMLLGVVWACERQVSTVEQPGLGRGPDLKPAITIIYDNNPYDTRLRPAWGFPCIIRRPENTILFDTGSDGVILLDNMEKLGVDPDELDIVVLSRTYMGITWGGLSDFLRKKGSVTVYMPVSFPRSLKNQVEFNGANLEEIREAKEPAPGLFTTGEVGARLKEQSLVVATSRGSAVVTGCAHPGIVNIVRQAKEVMGDSRVHLVLGGFHCREHRLSGLSPSSMSSFGWVSRR